MSKQCLCAYIREGTTILKLSQNAIDIVRYDYCSPTDFGQIRYVGCMCIQEYCGWICLLTKARNDLIKKKTVRRI